ncbi:MAG: dockerin type I repeat-containing protein [Oscillospiraceae bacterium]|nr:dockerin type I repeat-containing protein [Oscillospiraceae bacterium]
MKRRLTAILLACMMVAALCLTASAEEADSGFYGIGTAENLTVTPNGEYREASELDGFYAGSDRMTVSYAAAQNGYEYLVMLVSGSDLPTAASEILYIDQKTAVDNTAAFTVYPLLNGTEDMTLFLTSNAPGFETIGVPVKYYSPQPAYTLGDIDGENGINSYDASLILQHLVGTYEFIGNGALAADVDCENGVNSYDASLILQYLVGTYDIGN